METCKFDFEGKISKFISDIFRRKMTKKPSFCNFVKVARVTRRQELTIVENVGDV